MIPGSTMQLTLLQPVLILMACGLQLWLTKVDSPLADYFSYALYLIISYRIIYPLIQTLYRWNFVMLKGLQGPESPSILFGHMAMFYLSECDSLWYEWEKRFGLVYRIRSAFNEPELVITDPKAISYVLNNEDTFRRSESTQQALQAAFDGGVFVSSGEEHRRQRKPLNAAFTANAVQEVSDTLYDLVNQVCEGWRDELEALPTRCKTIDVMKTVQVLATDAISRTGFAYSIADSSGPVLDLLDRLRGLEDNHFTVLLQLLFNKFPLLIHIPNPVTRKWSKLRIELGKLADEVWENGIVDKKYHSKLLDAVAQQDRRLAVAHIVAIMYAGSETTANVITETLHKLAMHPAVQGKLRKELFDLRERSGGHIEYEDLINPDKLPYLDAVMKEALRVLSNVPQISRRARVEEVIPLQYPIQMDGKTVNEIHVLPGQTLHMPSRDGINTTPRLWGPTGKQFIPERWLKPLPEAVSHIRIPGHVLTFGDGPKICIGRLFAYTEFKIFVSTLVQHFEFGPSLRNDEREIVFHLYGPTVKAKVKGKEHEGGQLPLAVKLL